MNLKIVNLAFIQLYQVYLITYNMIKDKLITSQNRYYKYSNGHDITAYLGKIAATPSLEKSVNRLIATFNKRFGGKSSLTKSHKR